MQHNIEVIGSYLSPYVRKVLATLHHKSIAYGIDPIVPFFGSEEFHKLSPLRRVPLLLDRKNDVKLVDSTVICEYLDEAFPELRPTIPRTSAKARAAARWIEELSDTRLCDIIIWRIWNEKSIQRFVWRKEPNQEVVDRALSVEIPELLGVLEHQIAQPLLQGRSSSGFLFGEEPVTADYALASPRNLQLLGLALEELPGAQHAPLTISLVQRTLDRPELSKLRPYEELCLRVPPHLHRAALQEKTDAPISTTCNFGTEKPTQGLARQS